MNGLAKEMANSAVNGFLSSALTGGILFVIGLIYFHFYKKTDKYKKILQEEIKKSNIEKQDNIENQKTELLVNMLEKENEKQP